MTIREQLDKLLEVGAEFVVAGGQAGVFRRAIEFSHDLDIVIRPTPENAARIQRAVLLITHVDVDPQSLLSRDFQQYFNAETNEEIDIHLRLIALPDWETVVRNSSVVDVDGLLVPCLELPALYASKRTDRPRDALHRQAIEHRLRALVLAGTVVPDEVVLACCLDTTIASMPEVSGRLATLASTTAQPLLQARLLAYTQTEDRLRANAGLHPVLNSLLSLDTDTRAKVLAHAARFAALLARLPLILPENGYRLALSTSTP